MRELVSGPPHLVRSKENGTGVWNGIETLSLSLSLTCALGVERVHSSPGPVQQKTPGTVDKVIVWGCCECIEGSNIVKQMPSSLQLKQLVTKLKDLPKKIAENLKKKPLFVYLLSEVMFLHQPPHPHCPRGTVGSMVPCLLHSLPMT